MTSSLRTVRVNRTLWIEIHNPPANFLTADLCGELHAVLLAAEGDDTRCIVLTGGLPDRYIFHFSIPELARIPGDNRKFLLHFVNRRFLAAQAGMTLWLMDRSRLFERAVLALTKSLRGACSTLYLWHQMMATYRAIERSSKITIAAINGTCNGGGTEMATCFDFRFMVSDADHTIGQPEVMVGIVAGGGGTQRLPRLIGKAKALEFMLTCDQWTPQQAKTHGLITDHFPKAEFRDAVQAFADRLSRRSAVAASQTKLAVTRGLDSGLLHGLGVEMAASVTCCADRGTERALEAYAAVLEDGIMNAKGPPLTVPEIQQFMESDKMVQLFERGDQAP